jgi:FG-GAP-like repeat
VILAIAAVLSLLVWSRGAAWPVEPLAAFAAGQESPPRAQAHPSAQAHPGAKQSARQSATDEGNAKLLEFTFTDVSHRMGIVLPAVEHAAPWSRSQPIPSSAYSLEYARQALVPAMGGSVAVGDYDGDGHPDLYVVVPGGSNHLFHNNGDGTFREVTARAGVSGPADSLSATFADYDHSGHPSLLVAGLGNVTVYHNNGDGTFTDVTEKAGIHLAAGELATRAVLVDMDNDGWPDLLVTLYTDLASPPKKPSFVFPNDFASVLSRLYRNRGDGTFEDVTASAGLAFNPGRTRNAIFADLDGDGRPDVLLLRDNKPPALYINQGGGKFADRTDRAGEDIWDYAFSEGQVADFNHDGKPDLALWSSIAYKVLLNQGKASFDEAKKLPLVSPPPGPFGFHGTVADLFGHGTENLLAAESGGGWRVLVNPAGPSPQGIVTLGAKSKTGDGTAHAQPLKQFFSSVVPVRLGKHVDLVALQTDGQVAVFESRTQ